MPEVVAGEAFTKLRYDRRICGRRDARPALVVFSLLDDNPNVFAVVPSPPDCHRRSRDLLTRYADQDFSHVDSIVLLTAESSLEVDRILTVDASLAAYRFSRQVLVETAS